MRNQMKHVPKCVGGVYTGSAILRGFVKKNPGKSYKKKVKGVATTPLGE